MDFALERLRLTNFRCFESAELELNEDLNVLIGDNGQGKSAALDAIAICLAQLLGPVQAKPRTPVRDRANIVPSDASTSYAFPPYRGASFPVELEAIARRDDMTVTWEGAALGSDSPPEWTISPEAAAVASAKTLELGAEVVLPVFAFYGTNRAVSHVRQSQRPDVGPISRRFGYQNALRNDGGLTELGPWLAQGEWERSARGRSIWGAALDAVYEASARVLASHRVTRVSYSMEERDLVLDFAQLDEKTSTLSVESPGSVIPMSLSANGYRSTLGIAADLAFRCGVLNHHLGGEAPQLTSGVVLIDEIDMHLHPTWQTTILDDLRNAFPRVQFIITTHSPFILSSISSDALRRIEHIDGRSSFTLSTRTTEGARIDLLAEALLEAPVRAPSSFATLLDDLAQALRDRDLDSAEGFAKRLQESDPPVEDQEATRLLQELRWRQERAEDAGAGD